MGLGPGVREGGRLRDGTPVEPTPGAPTRAGSQHGVRQAGDWAAGSLAGVWPGVSLSLPGDAASPGPSALPCEACRRPGNQRPLNSPGLWQEEVQAPWPLRPPSCQAGPCVFYRVPAPGHRLELVSWQWGFHISCNVRVCVCVCVWLFKPPVYVLLRRSQLKSCLNELYVPCA